VTAEGELPVQDGGDGPVPVVFCGEQVFGVEVGVDQLPGAADGVESGRCRGRVLAQGVLLGGSECVVGVPCSQAAVDETGEVSDGFAASWRGDQVGALEEAWTWEGDCADRGKDGADRAAECSCLAGVEVGEDRADQGARYEPGDHDGVARRRPVGVGGDDFGDRYDAGEAFGQGGFDGAAVVVEVTAQNVLVAGVGDEQNVGVAVPTRECPGMFDLMTR
jgi:hypothetical protein